MCLVQQIDSSFMTARCLGSERFVMSAITETTRIASWPLPRVEAVTRKERPEDESTKVIKAC
jgi:hypothetical protein